MVLDIQCDRRISLMGDQLTYYFRPWLAAVVARWPPFWHLAPGLQSSAHHAVDRLAFHDRRCKLGDPFGAFVAAQAGRRRSRRLCRVCFAMGPDAIYIDTLRRVAGHRSTNAPDARRKVQAWILGDAQ